MWDGALSGRWTGPDRVLELAGIAGWSSDGGSSPFRGLTGDGNFWVKPLNNTQSPHVTINEFVIARLGQLVGAPVCEVQVIRIRPELVGQPFCAARQLEEGLACGSRDVPYVNPKRSLEHRPEDDNRRRHAGVYALYDWCWGADDQWLYESVRENRLHSHDHGHFLPGGPDWTIPQLESCVDEPHQLAGDPSGLDVDALDRYADGTVRTSV